MASPLKSALAIVRDTVFFVCDTVNVLPPTVMVPVRAFPGFDATLYAIVLDPEPEAPLVTVSHDAELAAVEEQPDGAVSEKLPLEPAPVTVTDVGEMA
jgi:hypothetical protein